ncbi:hypothetical protein ACB092_12G087800 [Castanea dentata]
MARLWWLTLTVMADSVAMSWQAIVVGSPPQEINLISCDPMGHISDIKLIRTDTTLDLSQKAEKGMIWLAPSFCFYFLASPPPYSFLRDVGFALES